jgi:hypothetical protein
LHNCNVLLLTGASGSSRENLWKSATEQGHAERSPE